MATTKAKAQDHNIFLIDNSPRVSHVEARAAGEAVLRHLQFALWEAADKASGRDLGALAVQEQCAVVIAGSRETSNQWRREEPSACTEHILEVCPMRTGIGVCRALYFDVVFVKYVQSLPPFPFSSLATRASPVPCAASAPSRPRWSTP